jgi:hypothetical protein
VKSLKILAAGVALLAAVILTVRAADAVSSKDIMQKINDEKKGLIFEIGKDLKADTPDWKEIAQYTKEVSTLAGDLGKNKPPKGEASSWEKLTKAYAEAAKKLDDAAASKDKKAASDAQTAMATNCRMCHIAHRVK